MTFQVKSDHVYITPDMYPINTPLKMKLPHWKYFKQGMILEHPNPSGPALKPIKAFHFTDSKGNETFIQLCPDMIFR